MIEIDPTEWGEFRQEIKGIAEDINEIKVDVKNQNGRVRKLENWRSWLAGAIFVLGSIGGYIRWG